MSKHELTVRLRHMRDYAIEARAMAQGRSRADLDADRMLNLALTRLLEVIGEAAARIAREDQQRYPAVPWTQIVGLRNRLIPATIRLTLMSCGKSSFAIFLY